jgi:hypothetical protein
LNSGSRILIAVASLVCLLATTRAEAMAVWPGGGWVAMTAGGSDYWDDIGDENPDSTDIVGGLDGGTFFSAGYYYQDVANDQLLFRIRIDADGSSSNNVWQVLFETDGDASTIDWVLELRQSGSPSGKQVIFTQASTGGSTYADVALSTSYSWTGAIPDWTRWIGVTDASTFDGDADFFLDIGMPLSTFKSITGLAPFEALQLAVSSSTAHSGITKDTPLGLVDSSDVSQGFGDSLTLVPEPGSHLLTAFGLCILAGIRSRAKRRRTGSRPV